MENKCKIGKEECQNCDPVNESLYEHRKPTKVIYILVFGTVIITLILSILYHYLK